MNPTGATAVCIKKTLKISSVSFWKRVLFCKDKFVLDWDGVEGKLVKVMIKLCTQHSSRCWEHPCTHLVVFAFWSFCCLVRSRSVHWLFL